ncbi:hypothetical protein TNCT_227461 [Trichonephila clavata]|uniref:Uncharacterized protein n=1 Tax=Trichonephila clavata TaxID=2740835 RepID=A0A8X6FNM3_TRICU|nr:hypothetical protein TNCT_227461 [Trichonephila clavata]
MGHQYSTEDKVNLFADYLESSFQENPEPYDDDFIEHMEAKVENFMHRNARRHTAPLTSPQEMMDIILNSPNKKAPGKRRHQKHSSEIPPSKCNNLHHENFQVEDFN